MTGRKLVHNPMSMFLHIKCFSGGLVFDTRVPLLTDKVSKYSSARQWKGISGKRLRRIDSVKGLSKLGDGLRLNAETQSAKERGAAPLRESRGGAGIQAAR